MKEDDRGVTKFTGKFHETKEDENVKKIKEGRINISVSPTESSHFRDRLIDAFQERVETARIAVSADTGISLPDDNTENKDFLGLTMQKLCALALCAKKEDIDNPENIGYYVGLSRAISKKKNRNK